MDADVIAALRCPVCGEPLETAPGGPPSSLRCPRGHSFDVARQGYVNLSAGRSPHSGDTAEMVAARAEFLAAGHYDFISAALAGAARAAYPGGLVLDAGAGTGRHLAAVLDALPAGPGLAGSRPRSEATRPDGAGHPGRPASEASATSPAGPGLAGLALDASKPALRRAARAHPRAGAALCDTWGRLPVADGVAGVVLDVFAPRNGPEFRRVLRPGGVLLVVTPAADHLAELVERLSLLQVDPDKVERVAASLEGHFRLAEQATLTRALKLSPREAATLVGMGPSAWHTGRPGAPVRLPDPITVTASVRLGVYVERSTSSQPAGGS